MAKQNKKTKNQELKHLYDKMGRVAYHLAQAEAVLGEAQAAHQRLRKQAVDIANQISQAEAVKESGDTDDDNG